MSATGIVGAPGHSGWVWIGARVTDQNPAQSLGDSVSGM